MDIGQLTALAPRRLTAHLHDIDRLIDVPANMCGFRQVVSNLRSCLTMLPAISRLSDVRFELDMEMIDEVVAWSTSMNFETSCQNLGLQPDNTEGLRRGILTANPVYAALFPRLDDEQARLTHVRAHVVLAVHRLQNMATPGSSYVSAIDRACRTIRKWSGELPIVLMPNLPEPRAISQAAFSRQIDPRKRAHKNGLDTDGHFALKYLVDLAEGNRVVREGNSAPRTFISKRTSGFPQNRDRSEVRFEVDGEIGVYTIVRGPTTVDSVVEDLVASGSPNFDVQTADEIITANFDDFASEERSPAQQRVRVEAIARNIARANQRLPDRVAALSAIDVRLLRDALEDAYCSPWSDLDVLRSATIVACLLATGRPFDQIVALVLRDPCDPSGVGLHRTDHGYFFALEAGQLQSVQELSDLARNQAVETGLLVWLPVPVLVAKLLDKVIGDVVPGQRIFGLAPSDITRSAQDFVDKCNDRFQTSITAKRIQGWLSNTIQLLDGGDAAAAALITGVSDPLAMNPMQYQAMSAKKVADIYQRSVSLLNDGQPALYLQCLDSFYTGLLPIGSRYVVCQKFLRKFIADMVSQLSTTSWKTRPLFALHNDITLYTCLMSVFGAGLRAVRDPILNPTDIDITGFAAIQDKDSPDNYNARLVWVPYVLRKQLEYYRNHLIALKPLLPADAKHEFPDVESSADVFSTPLVAFLLDQNFNARPISVAELKLAFAEIGWNLPINAGRHYARTYLRKYCSNDTVQAFLGHWSRGTEPWSSSSAFDPQNYRDELDFAMTRLLDQDGWVPVPGMTA